MSQNVQVLRLIVCSFSKLQVHEDMHEIDRGYDAWYPPPVIPWPPHASPADLVVAPFVQVLSKVGKRAELCRCRWFERVLSLSCVRSLWSQRYRNQLMAFVVRVSSVWRPDRFLPQKIKMRTTYSN